MRHNDKSLTENLEGDTPQVNIYKSTFFTFQVYSKKTKATW
jgi:hypothetical protein